MGRNNSGIQSNIVTICDSDYRGEVFVMLVNHSDKSFTVNHDDRIAQMVVARVARAHFFPVDELSSTDRGSGGFGSTGE